MKPSAINWPTITIGEHTLTVRWTFYAQWLLSKRGVNVKDLATVVKDRDPSLINVMVECFAAAVAENFKQMGLPVPDADYWAGQISDASFENPDIWQQCNTIIWEAVRKVTPAAKPATPQETAPEPATVTQ